jgi:hypothetical protein
MKKTVFLIIILALGLTEKFVFKKSHSTPTPISTEAQKKEATERTKNFEPQNPQFKCDGRMYCSQMTSCDEAKFFLENCPDVKMDGDDDGIPCEQQWCK